MVGMANRIPLADRMYDLLLKQLMEGARLPGDALNISLLTREFNVSQTPLREALARLESSGLVHREALKGYFVAASFTPEEIVKLSEVRVLLEPAIARKAALQTTPDFISKLKGTVEVLLSVGDGADSSAEDFSKYWNADDRFHRLIAAQSNNPFFIRAYENLSLQVQRFRLFTNRGATSANMAGREHQDILTALACGDADTAASAARLHVESARDRALSRLVSVGSHE